MHRHLAIERGCWPGLMTAHRSSMWLCLLSLFTCNAQIQAFVPVIGVLAQPDWPPNPDNQQSYVAASYVKWLEAEGARVVVLRYDEPQEVTASILAWVNGIVFPGGDFPIKLGSAYGDFGLFVFTEAVKQGIPSWGTCLGFEQLLYYSANETWPGPLTSGWNSTDGPTMLPLNITKAGKQSSLFNDWPTALLQAAGREPWFWHAHSWSVATHDFERRPVLRSFWEVLAVNSDARGLEFVSILKAKTLPIFASIFHPEKNAFEFQQPSPELAESLPAHSAGAVDATRRLAAAFIAECSKFRGVKFTTEDVYKWSIHKWQPVYTAPLGSMFEEQYFFPPWGKAANVQASSIRISNPIRIGNHDGSGRSMLSLKRQ